MSFDSDTFKACQFLLEKHAPLYLKVSSPLSKPGPKWGHHNRMPESVKTQIVDAYLGGTPMVEVCAKFAVSHTTVHRLVRKRKGK